jgi:hypothetical protein
MQEKEIRVVVQLRGGPADGHEFTFPEPPLFIGIGTPIARYERVASDGAVLIYRFVGEQLDK